VENPSYLGNQVTMKFGASGASGAKLAAKRPTSKIFDVG